MTLCIARLASFAPNEGPLAKVANAQKLTTYFAADVELRVDVPGHSLQTLSGRDELLQAAVAARNTLTALQVEFPDIAVKLGADKASAVVEVTLKAVVPSERDPGVQELKVTMKKVGRTWLIGRVETVRTLL
jgi:hypothetical protein